MCTRIRFLGWAPGSRVPSQAPTMGGSAARRIASPGINANHSPRGNARCFFMVDLLNEVAGEAGELRGRVRSMPSWLPQAYTGGRAFGLPVQPSAPDGVRVGWATVGSSRKSLDTTLN